MRVEYILPDGEIRETFELADGLTLQQAACTLFPDTEGRFPAPVIAVVGGKPAVRALGDWDFPLHGAGRIQFRQLPMGGGGGGGGSDPGRTIAMVAVTIAAVVTSALTYGAAAPAWGATYAAMFAGLASAAVMTAGTLLVSALFPTNLPNAGASGQLQARDNEAASPTYDINASGNQARLYQPEPHLFGRMRIKADYVAKYWSRYIGNDMYGYFVFALTAGECEVEAMLFGETAFWKNGHFLEDSGYVVDAGTQTAATPDVALNAGAGYCEPVSATVRGTEFRTVDLTFRFPGGLCTYYWRGAYQTRESYEELEWDDGGGYTVTRWRTVTVPAAWVMQEHTARVRVQLRAVDEDGNPEGEWMDQGETVWTEKTESAFERTLTLKPGYGRWQVRVANVGAARNDGRTREVVILSTVKGVAASVAVQFVKPGESVTIFPDNIHTSSEVAGQDLLGPNEEEYTGVAGPYAANPAGTTATRLYLDFTFPQGLYRINDSGGLASCSVSWIVDFQRIDDNGNAVGDWKRLADLSRTQATRTPQRLTYSYDVPEGRYRVRCRRTNNKGGTRDVDTLTWQALRAELPGRYTYPISCVAVAVMGNNTLSQSASREFSVIATRKLPLYDRAAKTWSEPVATRSWAAAVSHVCKSEWGGRLSDQNIDLDALWAIEERLQDKGWTYDSYIDGAYLVWTLIAEMCQSQCVIPRLVGPVLSFVLDAPGRPPTFSLTPRNIRRDTFQVNYITWGDDTPDDVVLDYLDADAGFAQRDVTAVLPESESREPTSLTVLGITSREHAFRVATRYAAHNRWGRIKVECQVEMLGRIVNKGDICTVSHPRFKNTASGAVVNWDAPALAVTVERDSARDVPDGWDMEGAGLYVSFTRADGTLWGPCKMAGISGGVITLDAGDYSTLLLQGAESPFDWMAGRHANRQPTAYTIYESRDYQRLMIVESVTSQDMHHYTLKLVNYDERVYQYEALPVPVWEGRGQIAISDVLNAPANLAGIIESVTGVRLVWAAVPGATGYDVELAVSGGAWEAVAHVTDTEYAAIVPQGMTYARVRAVADGKVSEWSLWQGNTSVPLPAAPTLTATAYAGHTAVVSWSAVANARHYAVTLRAPSGTLVYTVKTYGLSFTVTPEVQEGGPYDTLTVGVSSVNSTGASAEARITLRKPESDDPAADDDTPSEENGNG